ncbi:MAG: antibiotic biosynthesis monooxygenase [Anaerolineae bacterium]|nr:antibiotic biosynthesis monooxygenase [Anaerolineae bacterium]
MIEIIREFITKPGAGGRFELAFGPGGVWSRLFAGSTGFRGTTVLRDEADPRRYMTFDLWDSEVDHEQALAEQEEAYAAVIAGIDEWVASKQDLGTFRTLNRATVRPRPKARGRRAGRDSR